MEHAYRQNAEAAMAYRRGLPLDQGVHFASPGAGAFLASGGMDLSQLRNNGAFSVGAAYPSHLSSQSHLQLICLQPFTRDLGQSLPMGPASAFPAGWYSCPSGMQQLPTDSRLFFWAPVKTRIIQTDAASTASFLVCDDERRQKVARLAGGSPMTQEVRPRIFLAPPSTVASSCQAAGDRDNSSLCPSSGRALAAQEITGTASADLIAETSSNSVMERQQEKQQQRPASREEKPKPPVRVEASSTTQQVAVNKKKYNKDTSTFEERFEELKTFLKNNGHCRVPTANSGPFKELGYWVQRLRRSHKQLTQNSSTAQSDDSSQEDYYAGDKVAGPYKLSPDRIRRLEAIGFEWKLLPDQTPWHKRYEELYDFKQKHGHTNVPRAYSENPPLGEWVHTQRILYRKKSKVMEGGRTEKLEAIGFRWRSLKVRKTRRYVPWETRFQELCDFKERFGHLHVSRKGEYEMLARWVHSNRTQYRRKAKILMRGGRVEKMESIGFIWDITRTAKKRPRDMNTTGKPAGDASTSGSAVSKSKGVSSLVTEEDEETDDQDEDMETEDEFDEEGEETVQG